MSRRLSLNGREPAERWSIRRAQQRIFGARGIANSCNNAGVPKQGVLLAAESQLKNADVKAKAEAAAVWCKNASEYARTTNGKPWRYLLVPHDAVAQNMTLKALVDQYSMK